MGEDNSVGGSERTVFVVYGHQYESCQICAVYEDEESAEEARELTEEANVGPHWVTEVPLATEPKAWGTYL